MFKLSWIYEAHFYLPAYHCERRGAEQIELELRASFNSHMGISKNIISRKLLIFLICNIKQFFFLFGHMIDIRDEQAQPGLPGRNVI